MKLTEHFTLEELTATSTGLANVPDTATVVCLTYLAQQLETYRSLMGKPMRVNSGYRSAEVNARVGGVPHSQHTRGMAADITLGSKDDNRRLFDSIAAGGRFDQLIEYNGYGFLHLSFVPPHLGNNRKQVLHKTN
ncbi:MAG: peptidase M15 [Bacteroidaceae bacterium]|nr:peptidase M15 [Bacteroidaceae bacterium]